MDVESLRKSPRVWQKSFMMVVIFCTSFAGMAVFGDVLFEQLYKTRDVNTCAYASSFGILAKPNCISQAMKYSEGPWYDYRTNECGYRSAASCRPRPPGTLRLAMVGTSVTNGLAVAYPDTFAARTEAMLNARCGTSVNVQNASVAVASWGGIPQWHHVLDGLPDVLRLKPDAVVMTIAAMDLKFYSQPLAESRAMSMQQAYSPHMLPTYADVQKFVGGTALVRVPRSLMFRNRSLYFSRFLENGDNAGYLYKQLPSIWRMRAQVMQQVMVGIIDKAKAAGVPIVVVYFPPYPNAIAAQLASQYPALAPYGFDNIIKSVVISHGGKYIDLTAEVASRKDLADLYYVSNEHPNAAGNALIANRLVKTLPNMVPALERCKGV